MKVYVIVSIDGVQFVCRSLVDAEEMVLSLTEEYYYFQFYTTLQHTFTWSEEQCLEYAESVCDKCFYWIEETVFMGSIKQCYGLQCNRCAWKYNGGCSEWN